MTSAGKPLRLDPRGLSRVEAAAYTGLAVPTFDMYRRAGRLPKPTLPGKRYDRKLLDRAMDAMSGIVTTSDPLDEWKRRHGAA